MKNPAAFEPNRGQADAAFDYVATGFDHSFGLTATRLHAVIGTPSKPGFLGLTFVGANSGSKPTASDKLKSVNSYFHGSQTFVGIPTFAKVRYANIWKGIDVVYYGCEDRLEYDMVVAPNANPAQIRLRFDGANRATLAANGDLVLHTEAGDFTQRKPVAYQMSAGVRADVTATYVRDSNGSYSIALGTYDRSRELVIDPVVLISIGNTNGIAGGSVDARGAAMDSVGTYSYVVGSTLQSNSGLTLTASFAYVDVFDNTGTSVNRVSVGVGGAVANTFGRAIAVDQSGNAYITGYTDDTASGLFTQNAPQRSSGGGKDAFVTRLIPNFAAATPSFISSYSTYLGGNGDDIGNSISTDVSTSNAASGLIYVGGSSTSTNFPTAGRPSGQHGWVYALNTSQVGSASLVFALPVGGSGVDSVNGLSTDPSNNVYIGGATTSSNFSPTAGTGYKTTKTTNTNDGFLLKVNSSGSVLWSTFLPGGAINAVAQLSSRYAYVTGVTTGALDVTGTGYQVTAPGSTQANHAFFSRFDTGANGTGALTYSSYLGGQGSDSGNGIAVQLTTSTAGGSVNGRAMIVGTTTSPNFPINTPSGFPTAVGFASTVDGFLTYLDPSQSGNAGLGFSTCFTASGAVQGYGIATDIYGEASVALTAPNGSSTSGNLIKFGNQIWGADFYVRQLYADLLNRNPDSGGLAYWKALLLNTTTYPQGVETCDHTLTRTEEATCFTQSQEFTQWGLVIVKYYLAAWSTTPDFTGWAANFSTVVNSPTPTTTLTTSVFANFIASPNFTNVYGTVNNSTFVNKAYTNLLGRSPSSTELNAALSGTQTSVMLGLIQGSEYGNRVFAQAYANLMYMGFLRRNGDPGGLAFWASTLANQANLNAVISFFSTSQEYFNRFQ